MTTNSAYKRHIFNIHGLQRRDPLPTTDSRRHNRSRATNIIAIIQTSDGHNRDISSRYYDKNNRITK